MRTRRHRHQILEPSGLTIGVKYAFVTAYPDNPNSPWATTRVLADVISDTLQQASRRGWDLAKFRSPYAGGFSEAIPLDSLLLLNAHVGEDAVTLHEDGWSEHSDTGHIPTLTYWSAAKRMWCGWDHVITYLGSPEPVNDKHYYKPHYCIVVPEDRWLADPQLRAVESAADFEQKMRARMHEAMRTRHGF